MIKMMSLLNEDKNIKYEYGCVMLYFTFPEMTYLHKMVDSEDIYMEEGDGSFGLENEPHTTLLYGLHDTVSLDDVKEVLKKFTFGGLVAHEPSLFENKKYDVLKFNMKYPNKGEDFLHKCNDELKTYPFTSDFPNYHPHMTIGYIKPGKGNKYVRKIGQIEYRLKPEYAVFSQPDGTKTKIEINVR
jgi:2'-5' RNA ligase